MRRLAILGTGLLAACVLPSVAGAATVSYEGDVLVVRGDPGANELVSVGRGVGDATRLYVSEARGVRGSDPRCTVLDPSVQECEVPAGARVELGDGDDGFWWLDELPVPVTVDGGAGDDALYGSELPDDLRGGPGRDRVEGRAGDDRLDGGAGDDTLLGAAGSDVLAAGEGDDTLQPDGFNVAPAADVVDGGAGQDKVESEWLREVGSPQPVSLTLGGGADDGRPGEGDDLRGVEAVSLSVAATIVGTDGAERLENAQVTGPSDVRAGGGDDLVALSDGADRIDAGAGADVVDGGFGDDAIVGGPGRDRLDGDHPGGDCGPVYCKLPHGNDRIDARDGEVDVVSCGAGTDHVSADPVDVVAPDCERVERSGPAPTADPADPAGGSSASGARGGSAAGGVAVRATVTRTGLRAALRRGFVVRLTGVRGRVRLRAKRAGRVVATGSARSVEGRAIVRLRFTRTAVRSLRRSRKVVVRVEGAGVRRTVVLRR